MSNFLISLLSMLAPVSGNIVIHEPELPQVQRESFSARCPFGNLKIEIGTVPTGSVSIQVNGKRVLGTAFARLAAELSAPDTLANLAALCDLERQTFDLHILAAKRGGQTYFVGGRAYISKQGVYRFDGLNPIEEQRFWGIVP